MFLIVEAYCLKSIREESIGKYRGETFLPLTETGLMLSERFTPIGTANFGEDFIREGCTLTN